MKKILATILAAAAIPAMAGQDNLLATFSTQGPDRYADGTVVKDGESYALVWTKAGATFAGITVTGEAAGDQDLNRVLCVAPLAKDGRCRKEQQKQGQQFRFHRLKKLKWIVQII